MHRIEFKSTSTPFQFLTAFIMLLLAATVPVVAQESDTEAVIFILVRHAETEPDGTRDAPLSTTGETRAAALKALLSSQPIKGVYSTDYKRTKGTAQPLAEAKSLSVETYHPFDDKNFLNSLIEKHTGQTVLVAGHSNTIPVMVNLLIGEEKFEALDHSDYGNIFIVTATKTGNGTLVRLRY